MKTGLNRKVLAAVLLSGSLVGCWAFIALLAGLQHAGWQVTELIRQYMIATGMVKSTHTLVDFYSHIKGVEYLICVVFFVVFPLFYRYVNEDKKKIRTSNR